MRGLSVIIPSRHRENLSVCLAAVRRDSPAGTKVIVVDDGLDLAADNRELWAGSSSTLAFIPGLKPFIFARNINLGIRAAGADDVFLLNDDAILLPSDGTAAPPLSLLRAAAQRHPEFGVVSAAVSGEMSSAASEHAPVPIEQMKERFLDWDHFSIRQVVRKTIPFVAVYIPRVILTQVGLLDERFGGQSEREMIYGGEDDDYCYRVRRAGFRLGIFDGCVVDHGSLPSTFRGLNGSLPINATRKRFREIHGFEMGSQ